MMVQANDRSWGQIWAHGLLWGLWLSVCTHTAVAVRQGTESGLGVYRCMASGFSCRCMHLMEASDVSWAGSGYMSRCEGLGRQCDIPYPQGSPVGMHMEVRVGGWL